MRESGFYHSYWLTKSGLIILREKKNSNWKIFESKKTHYVHKKAELKHQANANLLSFFCYRIEQTECFSKF